MKQITLKSLHIENFKGCKELDINFGHRTNIFGRNAAGKSTIFDAVYWLLFDKNSTGESKFQVRPLDADGKRIDNIEIRVLGTFIVDGKEIPIEKIQKQKWVKKRGSDVAELQGNENIFKYNLEPKSEKEFKECISGLVSEKVFKMVTNPMEFPSMKWKDQRSMLMKLADDVEDKDVLSMDTMFSPLADMLEDHTIDAVAKIAADALKGLKKEQEELPVRIDEARKNIKDIDTAELELQKNGLKEQIAEIDKQIANGSAASNKVAELSQEKMKLRMDASTIYNDAEHELANKKSDLQMKITNFDRKFNNCRMDIARINADITDAKDRIERKTADIETYREKWKVENAREISEDATNCPYCGQELPDDKKQAVIDEFNQKKANAKQQINNIGIKLKNEIEDCNKVIEDSEKTLKSLNEGQISFNKEKGEAFLELQSLPDKADMSGNEKYREMIGKITDLDAEINKCSDGMTYDSQLKEKRTDLQSQLTEVEKQIAVAASNVEKEERVGKLEDRQREVAQQVSTQEQRQYLIEEFMRRKCQILEKKVSEKFQIVNFKLFDMQLNGGMKETCECMVNGVPFSSLNNGHRIVAGLDIISTICKLEDVSAPIFMDNAESLNGFNIPDIDSQLIRLIVSDDENMKVEVTDESN